MRRFYRIDCDGNVLEPVDRPSTQSELNHMLVLKRKEGQWVEITHEASQDMLRVRVCQIEAGFPGHLNLAFDDSARNFSIERPERNKQRPVDASVVIPVDPKYYDPDKR